MSTDLKDVLIQEEMRRMQRRDAARTMGEMMLKAMGDKIPEEQKDLFKEGFADLMSPEPYVPQAAIIGPIPPPPRSHLFIHRTDQTETVYDWRCLLARCSHHTRWLDDGSVTLFKGDQVLIRLIGEPATDFLDYIRPFLQPVGIAP